MTNIHTSNKIKIEHPKEEFFSIPSRSGLRGSFSKGVRNLEWRKGEKIMDYETMARDYLAEVERIDRRIDLLRRQGRDHRQADLWERIGHLREIRDDLRVTAHVLQRRAAQTA